MNLIAPVSFRVLTPHLRAAIAAALIMASATRAAVEVGVAEIDITPQTPIRLAGFPNPTRAVEIDTVTRHLQAKALAFGRDQEHPVIFVTMDLVGVSVDMRRELAARLSRKFREFSIDRLTLVATHNHSGPELETVLPYIFRKAATPEQAAHAAAYYPWLMDRLEEVATAAMQNRRPAELSYVQGAAHIAVNRRLLVDGKWTGFGENPDGPVDPTLPMMIVRDPDGALRAVWFNYACHAVSWLEPGVHPDWPGEAAQEIEARHPGAIVLFSAGCGGDLNPIGLREKKTDEHSQAIADEIERLLTQPARPLKAVPEVRYRRLSLPLDPPQPLDDWTKPGDRYRAVLEAQRAAGKAPPKTLPYFVQTWTFDEDLAMVFLAGEVVVDYALRLERDFKPDQLWVSAYANDQPSYIPSARLLPEGGYEVDGSRLYYGVPGRIAPAAEDLIIGTVHDLLPAAFLADPTAAASAEGDEWWKHNGHPRGAWWKNSPNYQGAEGDKIWENVAVPPAPVRSPEEELTTLSLPAGLRAELVASEPMIKRPVFLRFDPAGRLWVVEMTGYMRDVDASGVDDPTGRVVVLEDEDGDGRMDRATTFLDGLVMPRTLAFVQGGVLVVEPPKIWYARDTDGDLVCDEKTMVANDYGEAGNAEHSANALMPALDNWMYSAAHAMRYQFRQGQLIAEPTLHRGQWGMTQDDAGRLFYNYNASPLHADLVPGQYLATAGGGERSRRAPGAKPPLTNVSVADDFSLFPGHVTPLVTLGATDLRDDGTLKQFTAACAPFVYRGTLLPAAYRGDVFICEPVGNLVSRFAPRSDGPEVQARATHTDREFLVSTDERFRPSFLESGPDGALYVADMYTGIIEERRYVTEYLRNQIIKRDLNRFTETGRIFRIVPDGTPAVKAAPLAGLPGAALVEKLSDPNGWVRDTAQRLLVEAADTAVVPALKHLMTDGISPLGRLHALWTCDGLGAIDEATLLRAFDDPNPRLRAVALRLSEPLIASGSERLVTTFRDATRDADPGVRLQAVLSVGVVGAEWTGATIADLLLHDDSALLGSAAVTALSGLEAEFVVLVLAREDWNETDAGRSDVLAQLGEAVMGRKSPEELTALMHRLAAAPRPDWRVTALLDGMAAAKTGNIPIVLSAEPALLADLQASSLAGDPRLAANLARHFVWEGKAAPVQVAVKPLSAEEQRLFEIGRTQFATICVSCHQSNGLGLAGVAPSLVGSRRVNASPEAVIRILLHGLQGSMVMPGFGSVPGLMDDEKVAGALTYIRREWGNTGSPIFPQQVADLRAATLDRTAPWTEAELEAWLEPAETNP